MGGWWGSISQEGGGREGLWGGGVGGGSGWGSGWGGIINDKQSKKQQNFDCRSEMRTNVRNFHIFERIPMILQIVLRGSGSTH